MARFCATRDRDAYATIRGFVYQVELTIERWINLDATQTLELERGEDIDTVQRALSADTGEEQIRLLEQVKLRRGNLTLRSPEALAAVASFYEHLRANPNIDLRFRYVTNAVVGTERPSHFPGRTPAIVVWEQLRLRRIAEGKEPEYLLGIRRLLGGANKPDDLNDDTWFALKDFAKQGDDAEFISFIARVEWKTAAPNADELGPQIERALASFFEVPQNQTRAAYERLFLYVFKLICRPGIKSLTREVLQQQLALPDLAGDDLALFQRLCDTLPQLSARVGALEEGVRGLDAQVRALAAQSNIDFGLDPYQRQTAFEKPQMVRSLAVREETVKAISDRFEKTTWFALYGDVGCGKTHLARLIGEYRFEQVVWVRLRGLEASLAWLQIDGALEAVTGVRIVADQRPPYDSACCRLRPGTAMVLDDLPRLSRNDLLTDRSVMLATACLANEIHILSTSPYDLPGYLREALGERLICEEVPRFNETETAELLKAHGAPDWFCSDQSLRWLGAVTFGHPTLLTAAARHLAASNWQIDSEGFFELTLGNYAKRVDRETQILLSETVEDPDERELLYRLNLVASSFSAADARRVADVQPPVQHFSEKLQNLLGLWIQTDGVDSYLLSPLLARLGADNLSTGTARGVHLAVADAILEKRTLSPLDVFRLVNHMVSAREYNRAGASLLSALSAIEADGNIANDWGISGIWCDLPLPSEMDLNLRLTIRAKQVLVRGRLGQDVRYALDDLDLLAERALEEGAQLAPFALLLAGPLCRRTDTVRANRFLLRALEVLTDARPSDGQLLAVLDRVRPAELIWMTIISAGTLPEVQDWFETIDRLTPLQIETAFGSDKAEDGCLIAADRLWSLESTKPKGQQNWDLVLECLEGFSDRSLAFDNKLLWACLIRARMIVLGQYKGDADKAIALALQALDQASDESRVRFVISETAARQLWYAHRINDAAAWMESALAEPTDAYSLERLTAFLIASEVSGDSDRARSIYFAEQAVNLGRTAPTISASELVKALGEMAIGQWLGGDVRLAYEPLREGSERLLACRTDSDLWKGLCFVFAYVSTYLSQLARSGKESLILKGSEDYAPPKRGFFLSQLAEQATQYNDNLVPSLSYSIAVFAEVIGLDNEAATWALRAYDDARELGCRDALSRLAPQALQYLIIKDRLPEAVDVGFDFALLMAALRLLRSRNEEIPSGYVDTGAVLKEVTDDYWMETENFAAILALVPIALKMASKAVIAGAPTEEQALEIASICRDIGVGAHCKDLWEGAADVFDEIGSGETNWKPLANLGEKYGETGRTSLQLLYYMVASLRTTPPQAASIHLAVFPILCDYLQPFPAIYNNLLVRFIRAFWSDAFTQGRAYFSAPQRVAKELDCALNASNNEVVREVLKTVAYGTGVPLSTAASQWLNPEPR